MSQGRASLLSGRGDVQVHNIAEAAQEVLAIFPGQSEGSYVGNPIRATRSAARHFTPVKAAAVRNFGPRSELLLVLGPFDLVHSASITRKTLCNESFSG